MSFLTIYQRKYKAYFVWFSSPQQYCCNFFCSASFASFHSFGAVLHVFPKQALCWPTFLPLIMPFLLPAVPFHAGEIKIHLFAMLTYQSYLPHENPLATHSQNYFPEFELQLPAYC